jgi:hypothetical protein
MWMMAKWQRTQPEVTRDLCAHKKSDQRTIKTKNKTGEELEL